VVEPEATEDDLKNGTCEKLAKSWISEAFLTFWLHSSRRLNVKPKASENAD